jgi:hypothetical protein
MGIRESEEYKKMNPLDACACIEGILGWEDATDEEIAAAWQYVYDTGIVNTLPGFYGRTAMGLLENRLIER